mgnify:CR=1 FL=1
MQPCSVVQSPLLPTQVVAQLAHLYLGLSAHTPPGLNAHTLRAIMRPPPQVRIKRAGQRRGGQHVGPQERLSPGDVLLFPARLIRPAKRDEAESAPPAGRGRGCAVVPLESVRSWLLAQDEVSAPHRTSPYRTVPHRT